MAASFIDVWAYKPYIYSSISLAHLSIPIPTLGSSTLAILRKKNFNELYNCVVRCWVDVDAFSFIPSRSDSPNPQSFSQDKRKKISFQVVKKNSLFIEATLMFLVYLYQCGLRDLIYSAVFHWHFLLCISTKLDMNSASPLSSSFVTSHRRPEMVGGPVVGSSSSGSSVSSAVSSASPAANNNNNNNLPSFREQAEIHHQIMQVSSAGAPSA